MRKTTIGCMILLSTVGCSTEPTHHREEVEAEVRAAFSAFEQALNAGHYDTAIAFYGDVPHFRAYEDGKQAYDSWGQIRDAIEGLEVIGPGRFGYSSPDIRVLGPDAALLTTHFDTTIGDPPVASWKGVLTVLVERVNGAWAMVQLHSSTLDEPPVPDET